MTEIFSLVKEYWWLVLGIAGFIAWVVSVIIKVRELNLKDEELFLEDRDSFFWKGVGIVWTAALIIDVLNKSSKRSNG